MNFFNSMSLTERHKIIRWKAKALVLLKTLNVASESKLLPQSFTVWQALQSALMTNKKAVPEGTAR